MSSFALDLASQPTTPSTELKQPTAVTNMLHRAHPEDSLSAGEMSQVVGRGHLTYAPQVFRLDLSRPCRHWSDQGEHGREDGCDQSKPRLHREYPEAWTKRRTGDVPFGAIAKGRLTLTSPWTVRRGRSYGPHRDPPGARTSGIRRQASPLCACLVADHLTGGLEPLRFLENRRGLQL